VASSGNVCGILTGGVALISSLYSKGNLEEKDDSRMWRLSYKLFKHFENLTEPFGGIDCRDIAKLNWSDREATRDFYRNPESRRKLCTQLVGDFAFKLGEILDQEHLKNP